MKIIIAPSSIHDAIMKHLLKEENTCFNVSVLTLHAFKERFLNLAPSSLDMKIQAIPIISKLKDSCMILSSSLSYLDHQMSLIDFAIQCHHLSISFESLPEDNEKEKDIKRICLALRPIFSSFDSIQTAVSKLSQDLDVWIHPQPASAIDRVLIEALLEHHAKEYPIKVVASTKHLRHALNPALEVHGIAQHIAKNPTLKTNILCANSSDSSLLTHALNLLNIPFKSSIASSSSPIVSALLSACEYHISSDLDHFIKMCKHHLIPHPNTPSLLKYIETFSIPFEALFSPLNHVQSLTLKSDLFTRDIHNLVSLEKDAELSRQHIISVLSSWSITTWIEDVYHFLISRVDLSVDQHCALRQIKPICETVLKSSLGHEQKLNLLIHQLKLLSFTPNQSASNVMIHDLSQVFVGECDQLIIMGASAKHYPPTQKISGLVDESYLVKVNTYPSLSERNLALVAYEEHLFTQAFHTYLSYPSASMEGKPMEVAIDLKDRVNAADVLPWPVARHASHPLNKALGLSSLTATSLFFKNNVIKGSVSSVEQFFNCSYQYFFNRGLRLSKVIDGGISVAHMGTMMHFVLEQWVELQMPKLDEDFIMSALVDYRFDTAHLFPYHTHTLDLIFKLLTQQLLLTIQRFKHIEEMTHFKPYKSEVELHEKMELNDSTFLFNGFIDRIDHHDHSFRIIDYKSSAKAIKKEKFLTGRQIQLFTYQLLYSKQTGLKPTGVHYYNLKNSSINAKPQYNFNFRSINPKYEVNPINHRELFLSKAKLNGVYINSETASHYFGDQNRYNFKKDFTPKSNYMYIEKGVQEALDVIFSTFIHQLKEGKIDKNPAESIVCQYCEYQTICHFSKTFPKKPPLYEGDVVLKKQEVEKEGDE